MPLFVETVSPARTWVAVCLIIFFAIDTFKDMMTRFTFLYSEPWGVRFWVLLATPCLLPVVLSIVRFMAFSVSGYVHASVKWPHFQQFLYCGTSGFMLISQMVAIYCLILKHQLMIDLVVDLFVSPRCQPKLRVRCHLDNMWFWYEYDIIKDVHLSESFFN